MSAPYAPPTPNTAPNPTAPEHPWLHKLGGLATAVATGWAIHRGFHSDALGNPGEHLGTPLGEVAELAIIPATLAITGLRSQVTDMRLGRAEHRYAREDKQEKQALRRARENEDSYKRVMDGTPVRYDVDVARDAVEPDLGDKVRLAVLRKLKPSRAAHSGHPATSTKAHERDVKRMVNARNKRNAHIREAETQQKWFGRPQEYDHAQKVRPSHETTDLGTSVGWRRFYQSPRSKLEVRGYEHAVELHEHALHTAHSIDHKTEDAVVAKPLKQAEKHAERKAAVAEKIEKLQRRKTTIRERKDWQGKTADTVLRPVRAGARRIAEVARS